VEATGVERDEGGERSSEFITLGRNAGLRRSVETLTDLPETLIVNKRSEKSVFQ